jgi:hypothetical protein
LGRSSVKTTPGEFASSLKGVLRPYSGGRCGMIRNEEFMSGIMKYGRESAREFMARSQDMSDVISYMQAERYIELMKMISFVTTNLVTFEKKTEEKV